MCFSNVCCVLADTLVLFMFIYIYIYICFIYSFKTCDSRFLWQYGTRLNRSETGPRRTLQDPEIFAAVDLVPVMGTGQYRFGSLLWLREIHKNFQQKTNFHVKCHKVMTSVSGIDWIKMAGFSDTNFNRCDLRLQLPMTPWLLPLQKFDQKTHVAAEGARGGGHERQKHPKFFGVVIKGIYHPVTYPTLGRGWWLKVQASNSWSVCLNWLQDFYRKSLDASGSERGFRFPWNNSIQYFHAFHHFCLTPSSNKEIFVATFARVSCWNSCWNPTGHGWQVRFQTFSI